MLVGFVKCQQPTRINRHNRIPPGIRIQIQSAFESDRVFADKPTDVGIIIPGAHVVKVVLFGLYTELPCVFERLGDGFGLRHQFAVRVVGIAVDDLPVLIGDRDRMTGTVEVVGVELVGLGVDKTKQALAVEVVPCDLIAVIDFGEQIVGGNLPLILKMHDCKP